MNCLSRWRFRRLRLRSLMVCAALAAACGAPASEPRKPNNSLEYELRYDLRLDTESQTIDVSLEVSQHRQLLREMQFDVSRISDLEGDGKLSVAEGRATWLPPEDGGRLSWRVSVPHKRNSSGFDAWLDDEWGLFRAEDVIPRAATRTLKGATTNTSIGIHLPSSWSAVTEYAQDGGRFPVQKDDRRFDQPSGWIVVGQLGVRRDQIAGVRVAVAAPNGESVRRLDMLALLNWTLPELARVVPQMPPRLTIVSAGAPMWRGGLSAPQSIYMHRDRPLLSENGTSTLLHELMHVAIGARAEPGFDWIVEGFAEYYSLQLLHRSGTLSQARFERAIKDQREWSRAASTLCGSQSKAAGTALAVMRLHELDKEIREATAGKNNLDDVLQQLLERRETLGLDGLTEVATNILGKKPDALHIDKLPACPSGPTR